MLCFKDGEDEEQDMDEDKEQDVDEEAGAVSTLMKRSGSISMI